MVGCPSDEIISATKTKKLKIMFATHGIPKKIVSDNGPTLRVDN